MERAAISTPGRQFTLFIIAIALGIPACSRGDDSQSVGELVEPVAVTMDTLFAIGHPDGPDEEFLARNKRGGRVLMDVGPDGLIWVMNAIDRRLLIFDRDGERLAIMGQSGQGPGERKRPCSLGTFIGCTAGTPS